MKSLSKRYVREKFLGTAAIEYTSETSTRIRLQIFKVVIKHNLIFFSDLI